ncbi:MAG: saccharopine dehydrogenase NADP-binding domain-containing protein [Alphaproteobacteria bacterium]
MSQKQSFDGTFVLLGFGSIGNAGLDIIFNHIDLDPDRFFVVSESFDRADMHQDHGVSFVERCINSKNLDEVLDQFFNDDSGILVNASVNICSKALIEYCQRRSILYVDTSFEIWADLVGSEDMINNGGRFSDIQQAKKRFAGGASAITCHGANPGIVSHFAKRLICLLGQEELGSDFSQPRSQTDWAQLAHKLGITSVIITEMDDQRPDTPSTEKMALNTWSIYGLLEEASEKICVPFGTHEPINEAIAPFVLDASGVRYLEVDTRSALYHSLGYSPTFGVFSGMVIPHVEAFTIANFLSLREGDELLYQPTSYFCYQPCPAALDTVTNASRNDWHPDGPVRVMLEEIDRGIDSLGVMVFRNTTDEVVWYGSEVSTEISRAYKTTNATSLQVIAGLISSILYVMAHPREGLLEPEDLDTDFILGIAEPYLGNVYTHRVEAPFADGKSLFGRHPLTTPREIQADPRTIGVPL